MIRNKLSNIYKDIIKRKIFLNKELKKIIIKSVIQNLNLKPNIRSLAWKKNSKMKLISSISKQNNNICLNSGRFKGVIKLTQLSRHEMKKIGIKGSLQNIKIKAW